MAARSATGVLLKVGMVEEMLSAEIGIDGAMIVKDWCVQFQLS
jgi:hypothetical protein